MILFHTTPADNIENIDRKGLLICKSRGPYKSIWLHSKSRIDWARSHVSIRHATRPGAVLTLTVSVPRSWISRRGRGVWVCSRTIDPVRIHGSPRWLELLVEADWSSDQIRPEFIDLRYEGY
jgi:hypothetical protein